MAQTKEQQRALFPLPAYNYRVAAGGVAMSFTKVSGIAVERGHATYRDGFSYVFGESITQYPFEKFVPITMERGTVIGATHLYDWLDEGDARNIDVSLCDEAGTPVVTWKIARAVPVKLSAPPFDAASNELSVESLELMVAGVSLEHHEES